MLERLLSSQTHPESRTGLGPLIQRPDSLGGLSRATGKRLDLSLDRFLVGNEPLALGDRVEDQVGTDLPLRPRPQLLAQPRQRRLLLGAFRQANVEGPDDGVAPAVDQRRRNLEGMPRE